jgi:mitochondrial fission protein ELM1
MTKELKDLPNIHKALGSIRSTTKINELKETILRKERYNHKLRILIVIIKGANRNFEIDKHGQHMRICLKQVLNKQMLKKKAME